MSLKLHDVLYCNFMFLGALERPDSLVYNASKNIVIRPRFVKLQYKTSQSRTTRRFPVTGDVVRLVSEHPVTL